MSTSKTSEKKSRSERGKKSKGLKGPQGKRFTAAQKQHALTLIASGMKREQVSEVIGATVESLRRWMREAEAAGTMPVAGTLQTVPEKNEPMGKDGGVEGKTTEPIVSNKAGDVVQGRSVYAPKDPGEGLSSAEQSEILELKKQHPSYGPAQIRAQLKRFKGWRVSIKAIARVLEAEEIDHIIGRSYHPQGGGKVEFQKALDVLTRIGRPVRENPRDGAAEQNALLRALLSVATAILQHVSLRKPAIRALIVGAYLRLNQHHPQLTKERFCQTLALSPRTFRHWMAHRTQAPSAAAVSPPPEKKPPKKRTPRRPRFGFDVVLPDTQIAADTTDLRTFDVPLKLVAAQDIGGRDQDLLDSVIVDDRESSDHVIRAITCALDEKQGQQVLTDQGTPYMAQATEAAIEQLGAEHAPQKEADPLGKATIERAFGSVKHIAAPLFSLTSKIAQKIPSLRDPRLAKAAATLLLTALLKAYQAGARAARRADDQRASISVEQLDELAKKSRDDARAENRSARLLVQHIHRDYDIKRPLPLFLKQMRRFPLAVLKNAERAFAGQVHRDDIKDRASYFAAIARRCNEEHRRRLEIERTAQQEDRRLRREIQNARAARAARLADPAAWLSDALYMLAAQWIPQSGALLFAGAGLGKRSLLDALDRLVEMNGHFDAQDIAQGVFANFETTDPCGIGTQGLQAVRAVFETTVGEKRKKQSYCRPSFAAAILRNNGP